ncbi:MAG: response regulator transcription factor [Bacilli bacterium]|jgi:DNA-binding response OmpR family regulator|nr:response regulator transcription factor [Bacilli bacterium]
MKRILIVDDDNSYCKTIKAVLEDNYEVEIINNPLDYFIVIKNQKFDLYLIDLKMPEINGKQFIKIIEKNNDDTPIIVLTGCEDDSEEKDLLEYNISDYIRKTANLEVLVARINNAIKKGHKNKNIGFLYDEKEKIEIDLDNRLVKRNDKIIRLPFIEFELLCFLIKNKGTTFTREEILNRVWHEEYNYKELRTVDVHIQRLRNRLKIRSIVTIYGVGYRYNE